MKFIAYSLGASIMMSQFSFAASLNSSADGLWAKLCNSGQWIRLDINLGDQESPDRPPHAKICHAVCCSSKDEDCETKE